MVPDLAKGASYIHDYTCKKILRDTGNQNLAHIIVSDMYGKTNTASGKGYLNMKAHLTSIWFPSFYSILSDDLLSMPIHQGYRALSPYDITITVGDKNRTLNRVVSFLSPFVHIVNLDYDNQLNVTQSNGLVKINPRETFGEIETVSVNGVFLEENCTNGCATTDKGDDLEIEAWNIWGGRALGYVKSHKASIQEEPDWNVLLIVAMIMLIGVFIWRFSGQILQYVGLKRT
jgi:hypothetical protein